jgi:hypothetical protein
MALQVEHGERYLTRGGEFTLPVEVRSGAGGKMALVMLGNGIYYYVRVATGMLLPDRNDENPYDLVSLVPDTTLSVEHGLRYVTRSGTVTEPVEIDFATGGEVAIVRLDNGISFCVWVETGMVSPDERAPGPFDLVASAPRGMSTAPALEGASTAH